jgi:hypothetical protein
MPLIVKSGGDFEPAPEGLFAAVCVDVCDLGLLPTRWGERHKVKIVWELSPEMADGRRYIISKRYTASLHEKSNLYKDLVSWRGRPFSKDQLAGFDLETVLGAGCQVLVQHAERDGSCFANVVAVMKQSPRPEDRLKPTGHYTRLKDRPTDQSSPAAAPQQMPDDSEQIPF